MQRKKSKPTSSCSCDLQLNALVRQPVQIVWFIKPEASMGLLGLWLYSGEVLLFFEMIDSDPRFSCLSYGRTSQRLRSVGEKNESTESDTLFFVSCSVELGQLGLGQNSRRAMESTIFLPAWAIWNSTHELRSSTRFWFWFWFFFMPLSWFDVSLFRVSLLSRRLCMLWSNILHEGLLNFRTFRMIDDWSLLWSDVFRSFCTFCSSSWWFRSRTWHWFMLDLNYLELSPSCEVLSTAVILWSCWIEIAVRYVLFKHDSDYPLIGNP